MSFEQITAIVKRRWETGDHGHAHFRMTTGVNAAIRAQAPPPPVPHLEDALGSRLGQIMAIPIVIDDSLPEGQWKLVDNTTSEIFHVGHIFDTPGEP